MEKHPSLSIIVEWENAKSADVNRGLAMLEVLVSQLKELSTDLPAPSEMILVHDAEDDGSRDIAKIVAPLVADFPGTVKFAPCHGLDYYEQKNFGARQATNDAILLIDCDIVPCPSWLRNLLDCFAAEKADVVCGATHLEQTSLYQKAFALFWFFPLPSENPHRRRTNRFFANNVLFRADLLKQMPFPTCDLVRGKCVLLADLLLAQNRLLMLEPAAKVIHPPPNGLAHFIKRALCAGQDNALLNNYDGPRTALRRYRQRMEKAIRRIRTHRREVNLSFLGMAGAIFIAVAYFGFVFTGEVISLYNRTIIREHLRV